MISPELFTTPLFTSLILIAIVWSAVWKGIALWKAGRNNQIVWFVVLFLLNTLGILEIVYILFFRKKRK